MLIIDNELSGTTKRRSQGSPDKVSFCENTQVIKSKSPSGGFSPCLKGGSALGGRRCVYVSLHVWHTLWKMHCYNTIIY